MTKSQGKIKYWTEKEFKILKRHYPDKEMSWLLKRLDRPVAAINAMASKMGIPKSEKFMIKFHKKLAKAGKPHRRKKGQEPVNKGKTWDEQGIDKETQLRMRSSTFKKGQGANNMLPDGIITVRQERSGKLRYRRAYKWIKINGKWVMYHVYVWEQANGKVPDGLIVTFKTDDTMDCSIGNLELITRATHLFRNRLKDKGIAGMLARKKEQRGVIDKKLQKELMTRPDILDIKRQSLILNKTIREKEHEANNQKNDREDLSTQQGTAHDNLDSGTEKG